MKNLPNKIGVTGGIGSGKSLICKIFNQLGIPIYNADERAKWLIHNDPLLIEDIKKNFGDESYDSENNYNRNFIANQVFGNPGQLVLLNSLIHPRVAIDFDFWVENQQNNCPYIIKEAALIFESGSDKSLNKVINVAASKEVRIKRILMRDSFRSLEEIENIISRQLSEEERKRRADFTIINDDSKLVVPQVLKFHKILLEL